MIKLINVSKIYKGISIPVVALNNINLELERNGLTFILGKSGSGKSTLLNVIGLLDQPTSGTVFYLDNDYSGLKEIEKDYLRNDEIGFVFQNFNLINEFNVYDNLAIILDLKDKDEKDERIKEILKLVELDGYETRFPEELSAGQQQRVSIARALIKKPKVILADEPTGNVDSKTAKVVLDLFKKISKDI